ncbi:uncharacterized protein LOC100384324 [Zea mays]|uniref:Uncharacterized protein n=1 Tax=Zea mays TaxID=4577 RepID=C0PND6_MAIZE|nr:uncharacterized protein LOC100384324 [Zea mays]ACN36702.1 unknown [Zea mays]|eukprot:NP_001170348.1 uncharacterized protein LOC100384324 [Zea mays]
MAAPGRNFPPARGVVRAMELHTWPRPRRKALAALLPGSDLAQRPWPSAMEPALLQFGRSSPCTPAPSAGRRRALCTRTLRPAPALVPCSYGGRALRCRALSSLPSLNSPACILLLTRRAPGSPCAQAICWPRAKLSVRRHR